MKDFNKVYQRANDLSGGTLEILRCAVQGFNDARAAQAAASMAYYAFFSIFPLLIAVVAAGSFVLESQKVYQDIVDVLLQAFPSSEQLIKRNIDQVLKLRGPVGIVGLISLLWSGTGVFSALAFNVNQAWSEAESRNLLEKRLVALGMLGALVGLLLLSLLSTVARSLLPRLQVPLWGSISIYETALWAMLSNVIPWFFIFLLYLSLYRWVPNTDVRWFEAFWGAAVSALGWALATRAFTWYLSSGIAQYELVYGSLGAVVVLLFWIYLSSLITLFGAHLSAAVAHRPQGASSMA
jgi:membrane protein